MSSRFVSGGTIGTSSEETEKPQAREALTRVDVPAAREGTTSASEKKKNAEWEAVQAELEKERRQRQEARAKAVQGEEKSLYDVLQANKAAKQAAFEEANKLQNQFLSLNDDDVEFLDEVQAKKRREEQKLKQEMEEGLKAFRTRQKGEEAAEKKDEEEGNEWSVGRKRKRTVKERDEIKARRKSVEKKDEVRRKSVEKKDEVSGKSEEAEEVRKDEKKPALGLVDYGSDSDE